MNKSKNKKKGQTTMMGLVSWPKQKTEEAKEVPKKVEGAIGATR
jgi:hypothetical protein